MGVIRFIPNEQCISAHNNKADRQDSESNVSIHITFAIIDLKKIWIWYKKIKLFDVIWFKVENGSKYESDVEDF